MFKRDAYELFFIAVFTCMVFGLWLGYDAACEPTAEMAKTVETVVSTVDELSLDDIVAVVRIDHPTARSRQVKTALDHLVGLKAVAVRRVRIKDGSQARWTDGVTVAKKVYRLN